MRLIPSAIFAGTSLFVLTTAAYAQETAAAQDDTTAQASDDSAVEEEIFVTARRRNESAQDVPLTVNAVTNEDLQRLNIRSFEDISKIVPGLQLGGANNATIRGIAFNQFVSGFNGTIEFYLNDAPTISQNVFGQTFDIGQIEVLRGPQGTLRGRASPSGSITVTTRRPDLDEVGGYMNFTGTDLGGINLQAAVGVPIIPGVLALRIAGIADYSKFNADGTIVESTLSPIDQRFSTWGGRVSLRFEPTDNIALNVVYQKQRQNARRYDQVESAQVADPTAPASPVFIAPSDNLAIENEPDRARQEREHFSVNAQWSFAGQRLNYVGAINTVDNFFQLNTGPGAIADPGNYFGPLDPPILNTLYGQIQDPQYSKTKAHEIRLSSEERLFGFLDYVIGYFQQKTVSIGRISNATVFYNPATRTCHPSLGCVLRTPIFRDANNKETSFFGNLTAHIGERTEISGGLRRIKYSALSTLATGTATSFIPAATVDDHLKATIYSASIKHELSDNLMVYATTGSSWRPGPTAVGDFSLTPSARELQFTQLPPEKSKSYEIGVKSTLMQGLRLNVSAFYQKFKNFPFRPSTPQFYISTDANAAPPPATVQRVVQFNFVSPVPVKVKGIELELAYASENFDAGINASYAKGKLKNALVPCSDYFSNTTGANVSDGIPDTRTTPPTVAEILNATGGDTLAACSVSARASQAPLWTASIRSEYRLPVSSAANAFVRGQITLNGDSLNDPINPVDDYDGYGLFNLYAGLRAVNGAWEFSIYGKNITKTERVISRTQSVLTAPFRNLALGGAPDNGLTTYRGITTLAPREFGVNLRYAFGSR